MGGATLIHDCMLEEFVELAPLIWYIGTGLHYEQEGIKIVWNGGHCVDRHQKSFLLFIRFQPFFFIGFPACDLESDLSYLTVSELLWAKMLHFSRVELFFFVQFERDFLLSRLWWKSQKQGHSNWFLGGDVGDIHDC